MSKRFRAQCLICHWISSKLNSGPVFALWDGLKHVNKEHPNSDGFVVAAEAILVNKGDILDKKVNGVEE